MRNQEPRAQHTRLGAVLERRLVDASFDGVDLRGRDARHRRTDHPRHLQRLVVLDQTQLLELVDELEHLHVEVAEQAIVGARIGEPQRPPELERLGSHAGELGDLAVRVREILVGEDHVLDGEQPERPVSPGFVDHTTVDAQRLEQLAHRLEARAHPASDRATGWSSASPRRSSLDHAASRLGAVSFTRSTSS
jgi:hypothetical protein